MTRQGSIRSVLLLAVVTGCGLDVVAGIEEESTRPDGSGARSPDASPDLSASDAGPVGLGDTDASGDAGCQTVVVDDALTAIDDVRWRRSSNQPGYPLAVLSPGGKPMVALVPSMQPDRHGGLWLNQPVPTRAFDVTFEYLVTCPAGGSCGNGIAVAWMNTTQASDLDIVDTGASLGLPKRAGGAVTVSLIDDFEDHDVAKPPTLAIHSMEAGWPGSIALSSSSNALVRQIRAMSLSLRDGLLTVSTGEQGSASYTSKTASDFVGYFGFVAATSAAVEGAYVSSFRGTFHSCTP